jgi:alpha-beta hydrolase superfamily lysophospholipase
MFQYFPGNYMWSLGVMRALASGGQLGEIDWACRDIKEQATSVPGGDNEAWYRAWLKLSRQVQGIAQEAHTNGRNVTARDHYMRAALYYQWAEAFLHPNDGRCKPTYASHLECFAKGASLFTPQVEIVDIPFEGKTLYAYFVPAQNVAGRAPAVVLSDGLDGTKEEMFYAALALAQRGIACLAVDHPGQGATLRLSGLKARPDSEVAAGAALDYLETRGDVDRNRFGIMAASMGGYYAPRAAAFEKRFKACAAWAAIHDYRQVWVRRLKVEPGKAVSLNQQAALGTTGHHLLNILGVSDYDEALRYLEPFHLRDAAKAMTCDILIVHGEDDKQTPLEDAQALFDALQTNRKEMRVFTRSEGGAAHVQLDRPEPALSFICDWLKEHLLPRAAEVQRRRLA